MVGVEHQLRCPEGAQHRIERYTTLPRFDAVYDARCVLCNARGRRYSSYSLSPTSAISYLCKHFTQIWWKSKLLNLFLRNFADLFAELCGFLRFVSDFCRISRMFCGFLRIFYGFVAEFCGLFAELCGIIAEFYGICRGRKLQR